MHGLEYQDRLPFLTPVLFLTKPVEFNAVQTIADKVYSACSNGALCKDCLFSSFESVDCHYQRAATSEDVADLEVGTFH